MIACHSWGGVSAEEKRKKAVTVIRVCVGGHLSGRNDNLGFRENRKEWSRKKIIQNAIGPSTLKDGGHKVYN